MALDRQVITALNRDGTEMPGMTNVALKQADDSIVANKKYRAWIDTHSPLAGGG